MYAYFYNSSGVYCSESPEVLAVPPTSGDLDHWVSTSLSTLAPSDLCDLILEGTYRSILFFAPDSFVGIPAAGEFVEEGSRLERFDLLLESNGNSRWGASMVRKGSGEVVTRSQVDFELCPLSYPYTSVTFAKYEDGFDVIVVLESDSCAYSFVVPLSEFDLDDILDAFEPYMEQSWDPSVPSRLGFDWYFAGADLV